MNRIKIIAIREIKGKGIRTDRVITKIESCVNEILNKADGIIEKIEIATSLHQQNYDALTIRVVAIGRKT